MCNSMNDDPSLILIDENDSIYDIFGRVTSTGGYIFQELIFYPCISLSAISMGELMLFLSWN